MDSKKTTQAVIAGLLVLLAIIFFSSATLLTIEPGHRGVVFKRFAGGIKLDEQPLQQGFHIIAPWNKVYVYDVRKQEREETLDALSSNGLAISIEVSIRFFLMPERVSKLHNEIGRDYIKGIVIPEVRSAVREVIGKYTPEELYSTQREAIQTEIFDRTKEGLDRNHVDLDAILIRSIKLPDKIKAAIERKLEQEQQSQEYEFRLVKEEKEAKRKKIEAEGIREYQRIVSQGLTNRYLQWKGIEATEEISKSDNSKIVIIGGKDGLPVILNSN